MSSVYYMLGNPPVVKLPCNALTGSPALLVLKALIGCPPLNGKPAD
jgi:hypothetical protein